jgi:hypothetical protein
VRRNWPGRVPEERLMARVTQEMLDDPHVIIDGHYKRYDEVTLIGLYGVTFNLDALVWSHRIHEGQPSPFVAIYKPMPGRGGLPPSINDLVRVPIRQLIPSVAVRRRWARVSGVFVHDPAWEGVEGAA